MLKGFVRGFGGLLDGVFEALAHVSSILVAICRLEGAQEAEAASKGIHRGWALAYFGVRCWFKLAVFKVLRVERFLREIEPSLAGTATPVGPNWTGGGLTGCVHKVSAPVRTITFR